MKKLAIFLIIGFALVLGNIVFASKLDDSLIVLDSKDINDVKETVKEIRANGGDVDVVILPNILMAKADKNKIKNLKHFKENYVNKIDINKLADDKNLKIAARLWNRKIGYGIPISDFRKGGEIPSAIENDVLMSAPGGSSSGSLMAAPPLANQTSGYFYGDVYVSVIFMESNGNIDPNSENWNGLQMADIGDGITSGISWWIAKKPTNVATTLYMAFNYDIPTSYEPITRPQSNEDLWINDAMDNLSVPYYPDYKDRVKDYEFNLINSNNMDWAFTIFAVNSFNDADGKFSDGYFAYSWLNGPFMAVTYDNGAYGIANMNAIIAHEVGHIFGAADQYASSGCLPSLKYGFLQVENQNCENGGSSNVPSIMRGNLLTNYANNALDYYAMGQVGWRDLDSDNIDDAIDSTYNNETDNDGDGIVNYWDNCPSAFGPISNNGCPLPPPVITSASILANWNFNESSGNALDSAGKLNLNGTVYGAARVAGKSGNALQFNGINNYVYLGTCNFYTRVCPKNVEGLKIAPISVSTWFKTTSNNQMFIYRWRSYGLMLELNQGKVYAKTFDNTARLYSAGSTNSYNDGQWHNAVLTYSGIWNQPGGRLKLYIDGNLVSDVPANNLYFGSGGAAIGRDGDYSGSYFEGTIDEVKVYSGVLSQTDIQAQYNYLMS